MPWLDIAIKNYTFIWLLGDLTNIIADLFHDICYPYRMVGLL